RRKRAAEQVGDLKVPQHRRIRRADLLADAGVADVIDIVPRAHRVRAVLAVTRDGAIDDARIDRRERVVVHAELRHDTGPEAFDQYVRGLRQPEQHLAPG